MYQKCDLDILKRKMFELEIGFLTFFIKSGFKN
jgi:hypothetical protein